MAMKSYYIGVDVGTASVRAALFDETGQLSQISSEAIEIWNPKPNFYMQSTENIWMACCKVIQDITSDVDVQRIKGIGFDATCSLAIFDRGSNPLAAYPAGNDKFNVIMWLDHRASEQASRINRTNHPVLKNFGGQISLENQPPKLLWFREHCNEGSWNKLGYLFDLPDFLTWKATGDQSRSLCSLVCKWGYQADYKSHGWNDSFWETIGLPELLENNYQTIGNTVKMPGTPCGRGLTREAAEDMKLPPEIPVGTSIIDAHCGGIGLLGCQLAGADANGDISSRLALICGTSTCHIAVSKVPIFISGVWGPYYSVMIPELWVSEGGQSATGKLVDNIIETHPATRSIRDRLQINSIGHLHTSQIIDELDRILKGTKDEENVTTVSHLTENLHVWPDFHGNRSPIADPSLRGMISGLTLTGDEHQLACLYLATCQALAYGTRHIIETMTKAGHNFESIFICGGLSKNRLFVQTHADATGLPVVVPNSGESVLLGAAILGACAAGDFLGPQAAMAAMGGKGETITPNLNDKSYHNQKYKVFLEMLHDQQKYRAIMQV